MPKVTTNLTIGDHERLAAAMLPGESVGHFVADSVLREIARRERGGKVKLTKRVAGRPPKKSPAAS